MYWGAIWVYGSDMGLWVRYEFMGPIWVYGSDMGLWVRYEFMGPIVRCVMKCKLLKLGPYLT